MAEGLHFPRAMSEADALMWRMESDPLLRCTTAAVTLLSHAPEPAALVEVLEGAVRAIPRLRQRVVDLPVVLATPVWVEDPSFDLDYHLRWVRAPRDGSLRALLDLASSLTMQAFDRDRPLWEFLVVEGLEGGRSALVQKLHHAVTDGVAGVLLMQHVYETGEVPSKPLGHAAVHAHRPGRAELVAEVAAERASAAVRRLRGAASMAGQLTLHPLRTLARSATDLAALGSSMNPLLRPLSPLLVARSPRCRFEALDVPVAALKAAARAAQARLNDAFLAALAGGWRRYHEAHGAAVERLRANVPIDLRSRDEGAIAGNRFALTRIEIPVADPDPARRMRAIHELVDRERSRTLGWLQNVAVAVRRVPPPLLLAAFGGAARSADFVASCVPGPAGPLRVCGAAVEALYAFGPMVGTATNATLLSHGDRADVTLNVDPAAVRDPHELAECMREGFDEVLKLG